jgi:hypothetical protein
VGFVSGVINSAGMLFLAAKERKLIPEAIKNRESLNGSIVSPPIAYEGNLV